MQKVKYFIWGILSFMILNPIVSANSINISSNVSTMTKGDVATITVTISSDSPLVSIEGTLSCSGAGATGGLDLTFDDSSNSLYTKSYSYKVKAPSSGTLICSTKNVRFTSMASDNWQNLGGASKSITVKEPVVIPPKEYSKNNYLKSLSIEGYEIKFDKNTLEYSIEVENDVEKVNIKAVTEDSKASVIGTGEKEVSEGNNKLEVKVTAENGNERVYVINVKVKELDPVKVKIDGEEYTVIRKEDVLEAPKEYEKTTVNIDGEDVLAYYNKNSKYTLIGLKDKNGNASYYVYDNGKYIKYNEITVGSITINVLDIPKNKIPKNYIKTTIEINNLKLGAYRKDAKSDFYIIYGRNINTGKDNLYIYDKKENTLQRYEETEVVTNNSKDNNLVYIIAISLLSVALITVSIILFLKVKDKGNKRKKIKIEENNSDINF